MISAQRTVGSASAEHSQSGLQQAPAVASAVVPQQKANLPIRDLTPGHFLTLRCCLLRPDFWPSSKADLCGLSSSVHQWAALSVRWRVKHSAIAFSLGLCLAHGNTTLLPRSARAVGATHGGKSGDNLKQRSMPSSCFHICRPQLSTNQWQACRSYI